MTGEEQVYALFVQANPVPDPAGLSLTLETTKPLLQPAEEGRGIMLTEERSKTEAPKQKRSWSRPLAAAAGAFVLILAFGGIAWWLAGEADPLVVAAEDAGTTVTFDGQVVSYAGPELVSSGYVEFTFLNGSDVTATLVGWRFYDQAGLDAELAQHGRGEELALEQDTPPPTNAVIQFEMRVPAGGEEVARVFMPPGWYLVDVVTTESGYADYAWRADAIVEVVPE